MEMAGVTWTTWSKVTADTVGGVISGALDEMTEEHSASESLFEKLDKSKDGKQSKAKTPLGKSSMERSFHEASFSSLPSQAEAKSQPSKQVLEEQLVAEEQAALKVQKLQRGRNARKTVDKLKTEEKISVVSESQPSRQALEEQRVAEEHAALKVQKLQRGRNARKTVEKLKTEEASTIVVEDTTARAASLQDDGELRKSAKKPLEVLAIPDEAPPSPQMPSARAGECASSDAMVRAQVSAPARFSQLPSVCSWLRVR
jgi:hypothetical protein